jgi:diketogulonate reductase-like aldo/keto reductase
MLAMEAATCTKSNPSVSSDESTAHRPGASLPVLTQLPRVGLGTSFYPEDLRGPEPLPPKGTREYTALQNAQTERAVLFAIEHGYRLIDTANGYSNQRAVGTAIQHAIGHGLVRREELIVVCKIPARQLTSAESVREGIQQALERLRLSYVDVLMAHAPPVPAACWREMEAAVYSGHARCLGVSNFDKGAGQQELRSLMASAAVPPTVAQFER